MNAVLQPGVEFVRDRPTVDRVRRNLFGKSNTVKEDPEEWSHSLEEDQAKFREKWGFDVTTDTATPNSNFDWVQLDFEEVPDAFRRMGGCRPRRYSNTSICSASDDSFKSESGLNPESSFDSEAKSPVKPKETRKLITDYLQSQAKKTRSLKERALIRRLASQRPLSPQKK